MRMFHLSSSASDRRWSLQPEAPVHVERSRADLGASEILRAAAVAQTVRDLEGERDLTVTISPVGGRTRLLIAVDGSAAFLGLERADGVFQFATRSAGPAEPTRTLMIGGQQTDVESRYLLGVQEAATAIQDWLDDKESSVGFWDRR
jgi:hypothetical protein